MENEKIFQGEFLKLNIGLVYMLLINRISRDWSAEELSFLLGQDPNYIQDLETLVKQNVTIELIASLVYLQPESRVIFNFPDYEETYRYRLTVSYTERITRYVMEQFVNSQETIVLFDLIENNRDFIEKAESRSVAEETEKVEAFMATLIKTDYFKKARTTREIFRYVNLGLDSHIQPKRLQESLHRFLGKKGAFPLKRSKVRSFGYRYCFHK